MTQEGLITKMNDPGTHADFVMNDRRSRRQVRYRFHSDHRVSTAVSASEVSDAMTKLELPREGRQSVAHA